MKKIVIVFVLVFTSLFLFTSCNASYNALFGFSEAVTSTQISMRYKSMMGTKNYTLKPRDDSYGILGYRAELEKGTVNVYYELQGKKELIFTINGGEKIESSISGLNLGEVKIIIESEVKSENGLFMFALE